MPKPLRIVVVGAGVAGALVTYGLQDLDDVEILCLEKGPEENTLAGTGLNVGPNALKVLQQFSPELTAGLRSPDISLPWASWIAGLTDGTVILNLPLDKVADCTGIRIRWAELYHQLRSRLHRVQYHSRIIAMGYESSAEDSLLTIDWEDAHGDRHHLNQIDLILGCDGRYSQVRQTFFGTPTPQHLGVCIYRLLVPKNELVDDYQQWFHQGHRLLAFAIPGNEIYIAGSFPLQADLDIPEEAKTVDYLWNCYRPAQGYSPVCHFLATAVCDHLDQIHWARIQDIPPVFADDHGHVFCLGDSSHAMVPTLGQGATQAVEDGCVAASVIRQWWQDPQRSSVPDLLRHLTALRYDRIQFVQRFSRTASDSLLDGSDPAQSLRAKTQPAFLNQLKRLYCNTPAIVPND